MFEITPFIVLDPETKTFRVHSAPPGLAVDIPGYRRLPDAKPVWLLPGETVRNFGAPGISVNYATKTYTCSGGLKGSMPGSRRVTYGLSGERYIADEPDPEPEQDQST